MDSTQPTPLSIRRTGAVDAQEPSPNDSESSGASPGGWGQIEAPFTIRINGEVETLLINLDDDADLKAQEFSHAHNVNVTHERRIAEQIRRRQLAMARTVVQRLDAEARTSGSLFGPGSPSPAPSPVRGNKEDKSGMPGLESRSLALGFLSNTEREADGLGSTVREGGGGASGDPSSKDFMATMYHSALSEDRQAGEGGERGAAEALARRTKDRIRELEEELKDKERELNKVLSRSVRLQAQLDEGQARLRVTNNTEEQLKHASLQVENLKERLEEIEAREAEWRRKAHESIKEKEVMEKTARGRSREVRDLRRALQRFALDGTIHNALATAERLAREVSRAQELPSRNLPLTSPRPDVPEVDEEDEEGHFRLQASATGGGGGPRPNTADQAEAVMLRSALQDLLDRYEALQEMLVAQELLAEKEEGKDEATATERARVVRVHIENGPRVRSVEKTGIADRPRSANDATQAKQPIASSFRHHSRMTKSQSPKRSWRSGLRGGALPVITVRAAMRFSSPSHSPKRQKENRVPVRAHVSSPGSPATPSEWEATPVAKRVHESPSRKRRVDESGCRLAPEVLTVLQCLFVHYAGAERFRGSLSLSLTRFHRLCRDAGLFTLDGDLRPGDVDVAFRMYTGACAAAQSQRSSTTGPVRRRPEPAVNEKLLTLPNFIKALKHIAIKLYSDLIDAHVGRLAGTDCDYSKAASDAALDLLIDERLTPFSRRILPSGGTKAPLAPLPPGLKSKEGIALLLREEPALRKDIFNAFSTVFQPVRRRVSAQPAAGRAVSKNGGGATIIRRYMAFEQLHTALLTYDVVPKLMPIAQAFELFIQVVNRDRKNGMVVSISDGKQSEVPPDHMASFPQFVEIVARIAMQSFEDLGELTDMDKLTALFTWFRDDTLKGRVVFGRK